MLYTTLSISFGDDFSTIVWSTTTLIWVSETSGPRSFTTSRFAKRWYLLFCDNFCSNLTITVLKFGGNRVSCLFGPFWVMCLSWTKESAAVLTPVAVALLQNCVKYFVRATFFFFFCRKPATQTPKESREYYIGVCIFCVPRTSERTLHEWGVVAVSKLL